jgi:uncharacterized protein (TIGR03790 family)
MIAARFVLCAAVCAALVPPCASALDRSQLALVINTQDALSVQIGEYYASRRRISFQNVIKVGFPPGKATLTRAEFDALKARVDELVSPQVQAFALTWAAPYRVECMSITAAFAFGFDPAYCAEGCKLTRPSPYFNSPARLPFAQLGMRPAMAVAATSFERAKALIDRGVEADGTFPAGTAYLLSTSDALRNVRRASYRAVKMNFGRRLRVHELEQDSLNDKSDVLFYFTGRAKVEGLETLRFLPGAIADHLTSAGGVLSGDSGQMSALRWLEAGASGSYGAVVEPCNITQKFPDPVIAIGRYLQGETLLEAYWKSVAMPGQGIFIGEPLSAPFRPRASVR